MFSHTGNEIHNISKQLGRTPDRVITNRKPGEDINKHVLENDVVFCKNRPEVEDYERLLKDPDCVVTLHGWMRIIPKKICKMYEMYNLHPGLITKYPELKGADPQKKVATCEDESRYKQVGCVIHQVIPQVDAGKVLAETSCHNVYPNVVTLSCRLHQMATDLWVQFLTQTHQVNEAIA